MLVSSWREAARINVGCNMKITKEQELLLEAGATIVKTVRYPWGSLCPSCNRPHVFEYTDGSKICDKCDEVIVSGAMITTPNGGVQAPCAASCARSPGTKC